MANFSLKKKLGVQISSVDKLDDFLAITLSYQCVVLKMYRMIEKHNRFDILHC